MAAGGCCWLATDKSIATDAAVQIIVKSSIYEKKNKKKIREKRNYRLGEVFYFTQHSVVDMD